MTMLSGQFKWYTVAAALRDAAYTALDPPPCRYGVVAGAVAWDDCECGGLYVTVAQAYLSDTFPAPVEAPVGVGCSPSTEVAEIVVVVLRCASQPENPQTDPAPGPDELDADARQGLADAFNVLTAVDRELCAMKDDGGGDAEILDYVVQAQTAVGPEGMCVGSELHVLVALPRG